MKLTKNIQIKDKYFIYAYVIFVFTGIIFLTVQILSTSKFWKVQADILIRAYLLLINILVPFIVYQHSMIGVLTNHQRVKDKRIYIWKSRKIIFRDRLKCFVLYILSCMIIFYSTINIFGNSQFGEISILVCMTFSTIGINCIILFFLSKKFIHSSNNKLSNFKIFDKDLSWMNFDMHKKDVKEDNTIILSENHPFSIEIITLIDKHCNKHIFFAKNLAITYNTFNLENKNNFKVGHKGRLLSLIWLLQESVITKEEWDKDILSFLGIDYDSTYKKNRKKYIDDDTLKSSKLDLKAKMKHITETKAS